MNTRGRTELLLHVLRMWDSVVRGEGYFYLQDHEVLEILRAIKMARRRSYLLLLACLALGGYWIGRFAVVIYSALQ